MFDNFKEKDQSTIILEVFDVDIFSDIIKSFYGIKIKIKKNWEYQLVNYICHQYLLLECKLPETLEVPDNEFEEFLNITQSLEYTDQVINLVTENLPVDFNLDKLSIELIKEIEKRYFDYKILMIGNKGINIVDFNNNKINTIKEGNFYNLSYKKDFDIIKTTNYENNENVYYDLQGNFIDIGTINENNKKYGFFLEKINGKHLDYVTKLLTKLGQSYEYYNYSPDYKNIVFVTLLINEEDNSENDEDDKYQPRNIYIYNLESQKIKRVYKITNQKLSVNIRDRPLFIGNEIVFIEGDNYYSEVKIYSINDKTVKTIYETDNDFVTLKYNGDDYILISIERKNIVFSLSGNKIINKFNFECYMHKIDFISKEIIIASDTKGKYTDIRVYNIMTGLLIKNKRFKLKTSYYECISVNSPIKNKLRRYLDNY
nr:BTB POZ domain-containing protein [Megavirus caiporensis]